VVAVELAHLVLVAHRDQLDPRVIQVLLALPDLRATLVNADLPDQKALVVFRVLLDLLEAELEEPRFPVPKDLGVQLDLRAPQDLRATMVFQVLPDLLVPPGQMVNPDPRAMMVQLDPLALLDRRVLLDLLESVARPVRMQLPLNSTDISPRTRQPRPTARRPTSRTRFDRLIRLRTVPGTTLR
jgi:hypothetical protein